MLSGIAFYIFAYGESRQVKTTIVHGAWYTLAFLAMTSIYPSAGLATFGRWLT